jgi:hypothetical protein
MFGQDELFQLSGAELSVFVGHAYVGLAVSKIGGILAAEGDLDAGFTLSGMVYSMYPSLSIWRIR